MKCYDCGATVSRAVRQYREPKDARYKPGFRDVCEPCYENPVESKQSEIENDNTDDKPDFTSDPNDPTHPGWEA